MLLGFKERFVEPILEGTKIFTMRGKRKVEPKISERLYMYTGLRTAHCYKISDAHTLKSTQQVRFNIKRTWFTPKGEKPYNTITANIHVDGKPLLGDAWNEFIKGDGFTNLRDFADYWFASTEKANKAKKNTINHIGGTLTLYHWTDKRF